MADSTITFLILGAAVVVFISGKVPVAVAALGVAVSLWATGVLELDQALGGFGDPTVVFIAKKDAGFGTIISLMIPYTLIVLVAWLASSPPGSPSASRWARATPRRYRGLPPTQMGPYLPRRKSTASVAAGKARVIPAPV